MTTALDVLGLLTVAAGVFFAVQRWIGPAGLLPAGIVILAGSALAARRQRLRGPRR